MALRASQTNYVPLPDWCTPADRLVWDTSTPDGADRKFRRFIFSRFPDSFAVALANQYRRTYEAEGLRTANRQLLDINSSLSPTALRLASSDDDLVRFAERRARGFRLAAARLRDTTIAWPCLARQARAFRVQPPQGRGLTPAGGIARLGDERWWRRAVRTSHGRTVERVAILLGEVHRRAGIYASDETVKRRREQKRRNRRILEALLAVNELDQEFTLQELSDLSVSNPVIRRGELMTRIAGFEILAQARGDRAEFYTITCPSRMHARFAHDGQPNPKYDGTTPRQAQEYLAKQWAKVRAKLDRQNIGIYGLRIAEPQHDGTPHWHLILFMAPDHVEPVRQICRGYFLQADSDEPGAQKHRFKAVAIDRRRGTAAGYVAKYIAKNVDGFGLDSDLYGKDSTSSAERVDAWKSTWGIRQFQQIGGPPVSIWRELRRIRAGAPEGILADAWKAADSGEWADFVMVMGGPMATRKEQPINLLKVWSDERGRYGEPKGYRIKGVYAGPVEWPTRIHQWRVVRTDSVPSTSWNFVNNCTQLYQRC
ncbi:MAG: replication endonuclease [Proteobacteria bacterium]|nr:MAG: replication endonuclease [Pseudomonadota bacterium]